MNYATLGNHVSDAYIFRGSEKKPFLAPRGVFVANEMLIVADTGQNRVFIWHTIPTNEFQEPDVILGQTSIDNAGRNANEAVAANSLHYPSGVWSDGKKLIVADAWNHRVLVWHTLPTTNNQKADVVIGQPDFTKNSPNVEGQSADPSAKTLNWPYGVYSEGDNLYIADTGNRRVLYFSEIPTENFAAADGVIGKENFTSRDFENNNPVWPYSVKISPEGALAIADTQFYRVLIWNNKTDAFNRPADVIIGQPDFNASGQNQFRLAPMANTLNWTYDACFYKKGILVNDTGNSRILVYNNLPTTNSSPANFVIGRPDFETSSEFKENMHGTDSAIYWPFSIITSGDRDRLIIADTGNHRLVLGKLQT